MKSIKDIKRPVGDDVELAIKKYDGLSESELKDRLISAVTSAKNAGTFSPEQLDEFAAFASSSLDDGAKARLYELVDMIKRM